MSDVMVYRVMSNPAVGIHFELAATYSQGLKNEDATLILLEKLWPLPEKDFKMSKIKLAVVTVRPCESTHKTYCLNDYFTYLYCFKSMR